MIKFFYFSQHSVIDQRLTASSQQDLNYVRDGCPEKATFAVCKGTVWNDGEQGGGALFATTLSGCDTR